MHLRSIFFIGIIFILVSNLALAQRFEPGFTLGAANYSGDVSNFNPVNFRPAGDIFLRMNLSPKHALRTGLFYGQLEAADSKSKDPFQKIRDVSFKTQVLELSLRYEYNFRDFRAKSELVRLSPFVFVGGAANKMKVDGKFQDNTVKGIQLAIPFGVGLKYAMAYNWNLGFEFGARKTFTDHIDSIENTSNSGKFQLSNPNTKDMYYFLGISLSYAFEGVICPIRF